MKEIRLTKSLSDAEVEDIKGTFVDASHYDVCVRDTTTVYKPDGSILLIYIKDALPRRLVQTAFEVFKKVNVEQGGTNRGLAAGRIEDNVEDLEELLDGAKLQTNEEGVSTRYYPIKKDGTVSATARAIGVPTAIIGYFDRYPRINYCRQTAFNMDNPELWERAVPYIQKISEVFKQYAPKHYEEQMKFVKTIHPDFVIPGTCYTTLTINHSWRTAVHTDAGDFESGLGCMAAMEGGKYDGGEIIFPKYRVACDMRTGGVCLADVHSYHGNAPLVGDPGRFLRISAVFYARTNMAKCGSREFELERAKKTADQVATRHSTRSLKLF